MVPSSLESKSRVKRLEITLTDKTTPCLHTPLTARAETDQIESSWSFVLVDLREEAKKHLSMRHSTTRARHSSRTSSQGQLPELSLVCPATHAVA